MATVNIHQAKTHLSRFVDAVESGAEREVVIARNGKPAAKLVPIEKPTKRPLWGAAAGKWVIPDNIDALNPEIEKLFYGEDD